MWGGDFTPQLIELGIPLKSGGRQALLSLLATATKNRKWVLWVNGHQNISIYPPAWFAQGIVPSHIVFANSASPVKEFKQALLNTLFKLVVIDAAAHQVSNEECVFLTQQARAQKKIIVVIRNYFLSNRIGNPWARVRANINQLELKEEIVVSVIKGRL